MTFSSDERWIRRIQFLASDGKELLKIGGDTDLVRWDAFTIDADEQLLGCELHIGSGYLMGITWMKWRPPTM
jgi:hypothetical protein